MLFYSALIQTLQWIICCADLVLCALCLFGDKGPRLVIDYRNATFSLNNTGVDTQRIHNISGYFWYNDAESQIEYSYGSTSKPDSLVFRLLSLNSIRDYYTNDPDDSFYWDIDDGDTKSEGNWREEYATTDFNAMMGDVNQELSSRGWDPQQFNASIILIIAIVFAGMALFGLQFCCTYLIGVFLYILVFVFSTAGAALTLTCLHRYLDKIQQYGPSLSVTATKERDWTAVVLIVTSSINLLLCALLAWVELKGKNSIKSPSDPEEYPAGPQVSPTGVAGIELETVLTASDEKNRITSEEFYSLGRQIILQKSKHEEAPPKYEARGVGDT